MIIKAWGTWALFQDLLRVLRDIGGRHGGLSVSNIATRWVLDHPAVGAVIIGKYTQFLGEFHHQPRTGARLGCSEYPDDNAKVFGVSLTEEDRRHIDDVLKRSNGSRLIETIGDCGAEYR
jgi:diketogulonate reductase-like aldo/keto reductase